MIRLNKIRMKSFESCEQISWGRLNPDSLLTVPTKPEPVTTCNDVVELTAKPEADLETVPMICVKDCATNTSFTFPSLKFNSIAVVVSLTGSGFSIRFRATKDYGEFNDCVFAISKEKGTARSILAEQYKSIAKNAHETNSSATITLNEK
jgi:hypothetical protein